MKLVKYEKPACPACDKVEAFLNGNDVKFETRQAFDHPEEMAKLKVMAAPVTVVYDGDEVVAFSTGYNPEELEELIEKLN